ncbi:MAG TPA: hypothetical protein DCS97_06570 [Planctomycetes bacterium]|nr:hypothetical protein [Planctomycetota bacterium]
MRIRCACLHVLLFLTTSTILETAEPLLVGSAGHALEAETERQLTGEVRFQADAPSGVTATFIARSLRAVLNDDWRNSQVAAGTRLDANIDRPLTAFGSETQRLAWGIAGHEADWEDFSVQWDGLLQVPQSGMQLATRSDDGSRLWIDLNRDGVAQRSEWRSNGWGNGQGATLRPLQALEPGCWPLRLQYEEGGGGNSCQLLWRQRDGGDWVPVPPSAFSRVPILRLAGPIVVQAAFAGDGELRLGDGCILANAPTSGTVTITGRVILGADLDLGTARLHLEESAELRLAGYHLKAGEINGAGTIRLDAGSMAAGRISEASLRGTGHCRILADSELGGLDPGVALDLPGPATVRSPQRSCARIAARSPLVTVLELPGPRGAATTLNLSMSGTGAALGLVAWRADRQGRWFQRSVAGTLGDRPQSWGIDLGGDASLQASGHLAAWNPAAAATCGRAGLLLYGSGPPSGSVLIEAVWSAGRTATPPVRLLDLVPGPSAVSTGQRCMIRVRPEPFPARPLDAGEFALELVVTAPDGTSSRYAGFADQPYRRIDRGDREILVGDGRPCFAVRWRARQPGVHRLKLHATWAGGGTAQAELPAVTASGAPWDDIARPDRGDPRFLSSQGRWIWPIGHNLNSTYDVRSRSALATRLTPDRGSFVREALLDRLASAGGTGCEVWLSPWNLGLEWIDRWPGFHGAGQPNLGNAWALDRFLDQAERLGIRAIISIFNHGQGRDGSGAEDDWPHHPWNTANGGWLDSPAGLFTDPRARQGQLAMFRYLAARYGDSPAVLAWKLWAEVNLVHAPVASVRTWTDAVSLDFTALDPWKHPVTTHWCGDWRNADPVIARQAGIGLLTIDAYHGEETQIGALLGQSTRDPLRRANGLAAYAKPVQVTEYGGSAGACSGPRMEAEHAIGGWAGLVHGHAGMPMLWWFEWIDQGGRYGPFSALARFTAGEDLRGEDAGTIVLEARHPAALWARAWRRPGRILGYVLDESWARSGGDGARVHGGVLGCGDAAAGALVIEWWDADRGTILGRQHLLHAGGQLDLPMPEFSRHLAFKLWRVTGGSAQ